MTNTFATPRTAVIDRVTSESSIHLELNLDGTGKNDIFHVRAFLRPHVDCTVEALAD